MRCIDTQSEIMPRNDINLYCEFTCHFHIHYMGYRCRCLDWHLKEFEQWERNQTMQRSEAESSESICSGRIDLHLD